MAEKKKPNSEPFYKRKKPDETKEEGDIAKSAKKVIFYSYLRCSGKLSFFCRFRAKSFFLSRTGESN